MFLVKIKQNIDKIEDNCYMKVWTFSEISPKDTIPSKYSISQLHPRKIKENINFSDDFLFVLFFNVI